LSVSAFQGWNADGRTLVRPYIGAWASSLSFFRSRFMNW